MTTSKGGQVAEDVRLEMLRLRQENERLRQQLADTRAALRVTCEVIRGHRGCVFCRARRHYGLED